MGIKAIMLSCLLAVGLPIMAEASAPIVIVHDDKPIETIVKKPKDSFSAKMQWIQGIPRNRLKTAYMSVIFNDADFNEEQLEMIDEEFAKTKIEITPYADLVGSIKNDDDLQAVLNQYDSGIIIMVEKQNDGEVIMRGYLELPKDQMSYANYAARSVYGNRGSYDAKMLAFHKALRGFVNEIMAYRAGDVWPAYIDCWHSSIGRATHS